jgi:phage FluMu protein Com
LTPDFEERLEVRREIIFPREVLLVEVERRCGDPACNARARVALTKAEARAYTGFECPRCERWNADALAERDVPEWWEELKITSLEGLRPPRSVEEAGGESDDAVARMSDAWKSLGADGDAEPESEGGAEDKS